MKPEVLLSFAHVMHKAKNSDYGSSFDITCYKYGVSSVCIRLHDKLQRLETLETKDPAVVTENIFDTWYDLSSYAIMGMAHIDKLTNQCDDTSEQFMKLYEFLLSYCQDINIVHDFAKCQELNDAIWRISKETSQCATKLACIRDYLQQIAKIAIRKCLSCEASIPVL